MKAERWKQVDDLLDAALELSSDEREKFLNKRCNGDEELRREVLSLLAAHEKASGFMSDPAIEVAAKQMAQENPLVEIIGREFAEYKVEKLLGTGGMGEVYLAHDSKLNRKVALKILPSQFIKDEERIKRFEREARAVSSLNHPNLITIYDIGNSNGTHFIATEYVEGKTVRELIDKKISMKDALSIAMQVAESLTAAHSEKIVHRDIKPENIMVRPDGYVKVLDFGLAKLMEPNCEEIHNSFSHTQPGVVMGTLTYMSPEQAIGDSIDHRTDIWSLGVVLYEMMTGIAPFKGANRQETLNEILHKEPQSVMDSNPSLHLELDRIISKALEKDKDYRYQTASDFRSDLKRFKRELDSSPSVSSGMSSRTGTIKQQARMTSSTVSKRPFWQYVLAAVMFIALGAGIWFFALPLVWKPGAPVGPNWQQAENIQLTDFPRTENNPSLSPDGKSFVYARREGGDVDIFQQRVGGKNPVNLTPDSNEDESMPAYSPSGKFIAFHSTRKPAGIYVMEETGENQRFISDVGKHPSWSPDGKEIVVSELGVVLHREHKSRTSALWAIDVTTQNKRLITKGDAVQPSWSPNGHRIAYWFVEAGRPGEIATVSKDGGEPVIITHDDANDWNPVWSPDGKFLYFSSDRGGNMNLWRVAVDEKTGWPKGSPEAVTTPSKYSFNVTFSRDGKKLAYVRYEITANIQSVAFDSVAGKMAGEPVWVTNGSKEITAPHISPDGQHYAAQFLGSTQEDIVIFDKDGSHQLNLTDDTFLDRGPRWSPDGRQIAFQSDRSGSLQIWVINADGTGRRQVSFADENGAYLPVWSPDGKRLLINKINKQGITPLILDINKSWQEQTPQPLPPVKDFQGSFVAMDWSSADSDKIVGGLLDKIEGSAGLAVYSFSKNSYEKIADSGGSASWLNDGKRVIFMSENKIYLVNTQTKTSKEIFSPSSYNIEHTRISNDNKLIYFRYRQVEGDIWLLSLN